MGFFSPNEGDATLPKRNGDGHPGRCGGGRQGACNIADPLGPGPFLIAAGKRSMHLRKTVHSRLSLALRIQRYSIKNDPDAAEMVRHSAQNPAA